MVVSLMLIGSLPVFVFFGNDILRKVEDSQPSTCYGKVSKGGLMNGKRLPTRGPNYIAYSYLGAALGRNCVHSTVRDVMIEAYNNLRTLYPDKTFVYGETGWPRGGRFRPHITHQNGLSVDFMVPVLDNSGTSIPLPCNIFTKWGYAFEFDKRGRAGDLKIDFAGMAAHLYCLQQAARRKGIGIRLVIFAPDLQPHVLRTPYGKELTASIRFSRTPAKFRHDDHYHVDFAVHCKPLRH